MKLTLRAAALAFLLTVGIPAAVFAQTESIKASGTLMDAMCAGDVKTQADADAHTRDCGLMTHCAASGYGIVIDGKFHKFDAEGSKKAEAIFRSTKKTDHITATIEGTLQQNGNITVTTLTAE
jgi:hypothetical protein